MNSYTREFDHQMDGAWSSCGAKANSGVLHHVAGITPTAATAKATCDTVNTAGNAGLGQIRRQGGVHHRPVRAPVPAVNAVFRCCVGGLCRTLLLNVLKIFASRLIYPACSAR
ncbi:hypothetical protein KCP69_18725 [Salmonella enterica subsp. enterica]|nr:hypothetical protein KCP69_18725 [Salmonella enterica subsp. enterica]